MPQKALGKVKKIPRLGKKAPAMNRHGKLAKQKKGKFDKKAIVRGANATTDYLNSKTLSAQLNAKNETEAARRATQTGGKMHVVRPPPGTTSEPRGPKSKKQGPVVKMKTKKACGSLF